MANEGQPTIRVGARGEPVRHLQRALRRTPNPAVVLDGSFGPSTEAAVKDVQRASGLVVDGAVGPDDVGGAPRRRTDAPSGEGVLRGRRRPSSAGAHGWRAGPLGGGPAGRGRQVRAEHPRLRAGLPAVCGRQVDGVVGDQTWAVPLPSGEDLERAVGLDSAG